MLRFFGMLKYTHLASFFVGLIACKKDESSSAETDKTPAATEATSTEAAVTDEALVQRCATAVSKVSLDEMMKSKAKPSPEEQKDINIVRKLAQAKCVAEGLTPEQAACLDAIVDVETLLLSVDCPAIAAEKPSWLRVPPPAN